jgi:hypothetical protein
MLRGADAQMHTAPLFIMKDQEHKKGRPRGLPVLAPSGRRPEADIRGSCHCLVIMTRVLLFTSG